MSIASFVAVLVVLCWSGASAQGRTPVLSGGAVSFLSASGTSVVGFSLVNTEPGAGTRIPANLEIPAALRSDVARMIRSSPTFRRQCARIAEAAARIVVLVMPASDRRLTRSHAASSIDRDNGQLAATVILGSPNLRDQSEYLAHEIEHVLEQIEGVDLTSAVASGVTARPVSLASPAHPSPQVESELSLQAPRGRRRPDSRSERWPFGHRLHVRQRR